MTPRQLMTPPRRVRREPGQAPAAKVPSRVQRPLAAERRTLAAAATATTRQRAAPAMAAHDVSVEIKALLPQAQVNVEVGFRPGTELGIEVECVREWAIVRRAPVHAKVQKVDRS